MLDPETCVVSVMMGSLACVNECCHLDFFMRCTYLGLDKVVTQLELRVERGLGHVNVRAQETGVANLQSKKCDQTKRKESSGWMNEPGETCMSEKIIQRQNMLKSGK